MIYLDTAALVKLVRVESESAALVRWLNDRAGQPLIASCLVEVELPRALRRSHPGVLGSVAGVLGRLHRVDISAAVRANAAAYVDPALRTLDAIHAATAEFLVASGKDLTAFVTYDKRLAEVVARSGLPVVAPA
ncbi:type II toxin-antitoxin system VapC family toxin [Actinoplanes sp. NPDC051861]|uniref:type II toxin-antitoxin system VapC family toxin n=1 Tax=Actinoplanes sp. NPDC051861 TaxID=3155170 RepID=UPI00343A961D